MEDYALIGDRRSAALVARDGAIDWLCWPHFDSDACFSALLGDERHGCWKIAPRGKPHRIGRRYLDDTLILETRYETESGVVCVTDLMPIGTEHRAVIRKVTAEAGEIEMVLDLALRFDYGSIPPWLRAKPRVVHGVVGPTWWCSARPSTSPVLERGSSPNSPLRPAGGSPSHYNMACRTSSNRPRSTPRPP
jgi:GH15 family glucan-1,4-alpha-glucosidase